MSIPPFEVLQPESLQEACELLGKHSSEGAAVLAGGTDILVDIRRPIIPEHLPRCSGCDPKTLMPRKAVEKPPAYMVALSRIPDLSGISEAKNGDISIGSMTTITQICESQLVREKLTALAEGGDNLGSPLVRNRGTLGGNICNARPAADALVPSVALGAQLELQSVNETRIVSVSDFVTGPGRTIRKADEVLSKVIFPALPEMSGSSCIKLANRKALEISVVNVAAVLTLDKAGKISQAKVALGSVAPTPVLAEKAAASLIGEKPSDDLFKEAGKTAAGECKPITDHRGSALYRVDMVGILVKNALQKALERAR
ncbi:molybdopterin dehydrogenase [candidate division LCP-89 bacterium B3_LCP]|uniref:Molybdopterin dehydrogenase n=1 Tax=candidate division LCP-89 bacterium B3_LCP TaxID=2012998 RepID=A0A532UZ66_UNCL8|nr:MAG: molybdopterin dehydrogenase [candidate division LCP-89 bacterium B3_LCP]